MNKTSCLLEQTILPQFKLTSLFERLLLTKRRVSASSSQPLKNLTFVLEGSVDKAALTSKIAEMGGKVVKRVAKNTAAVISNEGEIRDRLTPINWIVNQCCRFFVYSLSSLGDLLSCILFSICYTLNVDLTCFLEGRCFAVSYLWRKHVFS